MSRMALYERVYQDILARIRSGEWPVGSALPITDELPGILGAGRTTVRKAIDLLIRDGYLDSVQGRSVSVKRAPD